MQSVAKEIPLSMAAHGDVPATAEPFVKGGVVGGKRHTHAESEERDLKRIRQSVESHLRVLLGLPVAPGTTRPFPVHIDAVKLYLRKVAEEAPQDELDGRSQTEVDSTG